ncbi:hypothetical protein BCR34DRAFT_591356 [Clohesyomyces aquaticus]|uniref:Uncharacterized protein n=1 Tax=Clohesyomyces aquaticus TaxID=1231657 RepID=A0A1Y1Z262_9PLEO|nr:hypothetical protein BCR34DRAFT_591356 [Clohesyomyces aquaticus]
MLLHNQHPTTLLSGAPLHQSANQPHNLPTLRHPHYTQSHLSNLKHDRPPPKSPSHLIPPQRTPKLKQSTRGPFQRLNPLPPPCFVTRYAYRSDAHGGKSVGVGGSMCCYSPLTAKRRIFGTRRSLRKALANIRGPIHQKWNLVIGTKVQLCKTPLHLNTTRNGVDATSAVFIPFSLSAIQIKQTKRSTNAVYNKKGDSCHSIEFRIRGYEKEQSRIREPASIPAGRSK